MAFEMRKKTLKRSETFNIESLSPGVPDRIITSDDWKLDQPLHHATVFYSLIRNLDDVNSSDAADILHHF